MHWTRRQFIRSTSSGLAAAALAHAARNTAFAAASEDDPFVALDGIAQAQLIAKKQASALDVLEAAIHRIEQLNPKVNAVVTTDFDAARSRARAGKFTGPFAGVPFLVKDLDDVAGVRSTYGSRAMMSKIAETTDPYIQACIEAGMNVAGKTNTPELGLTGTTESLALGPCYNPWNLTRSAGGSSGGAGAAVAAGMVPIAQGSDGGGSIRIPASCCGVFGLKVSRGRLIGSNDEFGFSVSGSLSRSVRDTAYLLAHTERKTPAPGLKAVGLVTGPNKRRLKIGMYIRGIGGTDPAADVRDAVRSTAMLCEELGHDVRQCRLELDAPRFVDDFLSMWSQEPGMLVEQLEKTLGRKVTHQDLEPLTLTFAEMYHSGAKDKIPAASERLQKVAQDIARQMEPFDVMLCPVLSTAPPLVGEYGPTVPYQALIDRTIKYVAYTPAYNVSGMPAMSVPLSWNEQGLPIGSQFAAKVGDERTLLELAYELEAARPWAGKWAPCSAEKITA